MFNKEGSISELISNLVPSHSTTIFLALSISFLIYLLNDPLSTGLKYSDSIYSNTKVLVTNLIRKGGLENKKIKKNSKIKLAINRRKKKK